MSQENPQQSVNAAYDSVNLINQLDALTPPLSNEDSATRVRNIEHLRIMMTKDWFTEALTVEQTDEINTLII
jgi:hypothetical protein